MNDPPDGIDRLAERIEALERCVHALESRVDALEHPLAARWPKPNQEAETAAAPESATAGFAVDSGSLFPVLGKALLGIAGAYVLRAVEEASFLPRSAVASAGIVYAFLWLVLAARSRGGPRFTSTIYACTSALILAPMLWELTLRFKVLSPAMSASVVAAYALAGVGLAWRRAAAPVLRVALIAAAGLAFMLAIASHAMTPFIAVLLIFTGVCEFVPALDRMIEIRAVVALAADAAIWMLIFAYFSPQNVREDFPALSRAVLLAPGLAIFVMFAAAITIRTVLRARKITAFETVQTIIALLLAAVSIADFGPAYGTTILGVFCLILSATCYALVFTIFERATERRNALVFSAWGAALFLGGSFLCLPPLLAVAVIGAGAIAAIVVSHWKNQPVFEFYGLVFLLAATASSGFLGFAASALIGSPSGGPALGAWLIVFCGVLCYAAANSREHEPWGLQTTHLLLAALAAGGVAALLVRGWLGLVASQVTTGPHHLALIRTLTLCAMALALVFSGARFRRVELTRLGYTALAFVAVKLVFEDLRHGHLAYIAASILLVALTLIAAPRMARAKQKA
jgi:hypothetical protein